MTYIGSKADLRVVGTRPVRPDGVDKVTGRAAFGADLQLPGMLHGRVKRSPYAHARIRSIDTSKALALKGVLAVLTADDVPDIPSEEAFVGEGPVNFRDLSRNCLARDKALYEGHAVAAVAATSASIAEAALDLIEVDYEVLPHVIDVEAAMAPGAPVLHDDLFTAGLPSTPTTPSNIAKRVEFKLGDAAAGFCGGGRHRRRAATPPRRSIRDISSRMPAWRAGVPTGSRRSGAAARASSWSAPTPRSCSAWKSPASASRQPKSAADSAVRRWCISSRWRWCCRAKRDVRCVWS